MPGINSRSKGARGERNVAKLLETWTNRKFAKTPASGGLQWKTSNSKGDVVCTTEGHYFPFCIEVKSYSKIDFSHLLTPNIKNIEILDFWDQCQRDAKKCCKVPMLLMRYNGLPKEFYFLVTTQEFAKLMHPELAMSNIGLHSLRYSDYSKPLHLMIMRSSEVFKTQYKTIKQIAKEHITQIYGKKTKKGRTHKESKKG